MVRCDVFNVTVQLRQNDQLHFEFITDLPPGTRVLVTCERSFLNYTGANSVWTGFDDFVEVKPSATEHLNGATGTVDVVSSDQLASSFFKETMKGKASKVTSPVSDDLHLVFTVGARQRLAEFGKNNCELNGRMVVHEGGVPYVSVRASVTCPMAVKYQPKRI